MFLYKHLMKNVNPVTTQEQLERHDHTKERRPIGSRNGLLSLIIRKLPQHREGQQSSTPYVGNGRT
jgi:hypothetical protein